MIEIYSCDLWSKTKTLAKEYGYEMSNHCPMSMICTGEHCVFLEPEENDESKLDKLREELKVSSK